MPQYRTLVQTRFVDVDGFGHVNNAVFLSYLENAREALYRDDTRLPALRDLMGAGVFILVSNQHIEYLTPLEYDGQSVCVPVWVSRVGNSSFDLSYRVGDDPVYATARTGMVIVDRASGRPTPMTDAQRKGFERWLDDPLTFRS